MTIKILPARLANQIAAGEVVERPASVVKELVENSLDSGATRIDIDIEKGGAKLIRVRDNGKGIVKDELALALSRHATSKIHTLDDLEAIMSLGFRGEALASISSVARLTMTSRPITQEQAWSAHSEGRDMQVKLQPAAHPIGTSVEVLDLFFNTPARRKFLRAEKTEFTHIDELLKRIALSRFDVTINLRHNGKSIRQYRAAKNEAQTEKRIAAVCGSAFVRNMLSIELEHQGLKLHGWITTPEGARQQSDLQYCYVNGRMMRDKLINHAIRQSYETSLRPDQFATYVLFIDVDPHQVDVNVHPAKHEVRFHQSRLVHDFIYQALSDGLAQSQHIEPAKTSESAFHIEKPPTDSDDTPKFGVETANRVFDAVSRTPSYPNKDNQNNGRTSDYDRDAFVPENSVREGRSRSDWNESTATSKYTSVKHHAEPAPSKREQRAYKELLSTPNESAEPPPAVVNKSEPSLDTCDPVAHGSSSILDLGKAVSVTANRYLVMGSKEQVVLVCLARAEWLRVRGQLEALHAELKSQPLLVPLSIKLTQDMITAVVEQRDSLLRLGIDLKPRNASTIMVMGVPQPLRQQNLQQLIPDLVSYIASKNATATPVSAAGLADWLSDNVTKIKDDYTLSEAIQIIGELEQLWQGQLPLDDGNFVKPVDFSATIAALLA